MVISLSQKGLMVQKLHQLRTRRIAPSFKLFLPLTVPGWE